MPTTTAIILAGGLGTRLRSAVPDLPKCMAPVAGHPFLYYVINYLRSQGIERFIFSLGYRHEAIESWLASQYSTLRYETVVEDEPLGTGGAIRLACSRAGTGPVVVTNGDTLFKADLPSMLARHGQTGAECTLALKPLQRFDRYGAVEIDDGGRVVAFREKQFYETGLINGGLYIIDAQLLAGEKFPERFSFEKDYLEKQVAPGKIFGTVHDQYFIDIGIPEDFNRAGLELLRKPLDLAGIDRSWALLIDRDGVINVEKKDEYVRSWQEFQFLPGVPQALARLSQVCGHLIIVSNQRGVGRGLMTEADLSDIHSQMLGQIRVAGGRIDRIYYCTSRDNTHPDRKPNPGMAFRAARDFPDLDLARTIMIGNKPSDMLFGRFAGVYTVFIATTNPEHPRDHGDIDLWFNSLEDFAKAL